MGGGTEDVLFFRADQCITNYVIPAERCGIRFLHRAPCASAVLT